MCRSACTDVSWRLRRSVMAHAPNTQNKKRLHTKNGPQKETAKQARARQQQQSKDRAEKLLAQKQLKAMQVWAGVVSAKVSPARLALETVLARGASLDLPNVLKTSIGRVRTTLLELEKEAKTVQEGKACILSVKNMKDLAWCCYA